MIQKIILIIGATLLLMMLAVGLVYFQLATLQPVGMTPVPSTDIPATGPETACRSDADCWCRNFTGAGFKEGKTPSSCGVNNHCVPCLYL